MTTDPATPSAVDELTYEEARDELAGVVRGLESGGLTLEQSLAMWERGQQLADRCQALLDAAQQRLDTAQRNQDTNSSSSG
jgi:exodeoxyribonuclease VII small subunit